MLRHRYRQSIQSANSDIKKYTPNKTWLHVTRLQLKQMAFLWSPSSPLISFLSWKFFGCFCFSFYTLHSLYSPPPGIKWDPIQIMSIYVGLSCQCLSGKTLPRTKRASLIRKGIGNYHLKREISFLCNKSWKWGLLGCCLNSLNADLKTILSEGCKNDRKVRNIAFWNQTPGWNM